jgi:hypothetical protein
MKNKYNIKEDIVTIFLVDRNNNIRETFINLEDFEKVNNYNGTFFASYRDNIKKYYCCITLYLGIINGKPKYKTEYLHKIIKNIFYKNVEIDHIDHNTLNNVKENLRISVTKLNSRNRNKRNINNTSGYRNVSFIKGWWVIQLQIDGKNKKIGKFKNLNEAGAFAEKMRNKYYKEFSGNN